MKLSQIASKPSPSYKYRFEKEQHRRQALERHVEALALERDALKWRLHVAQRQSLDKF